MYSNFFLQISLRTFWLIKIALVRTFRNIQWNSNPSLTKHANSFKNSQRTFLKAISHFLFRYKGPDYPNYAQKTDDEEEEYDDNIRVVLTAPHKDTLLETDDVAFMLVQYEQKEENTIEAEI